MPKKNESKCKVCKTVTLKYQLYKDLCQSCWSNVPEEDKLIESFCYQKKKGCCYWFPYFNWMCAKCIYYIDATGLETEKVIIDEYFLNNPHFVQLLKPKVVRPVKEYIEYGCECDNYSIDPLDDNNLNHSCKCILVYVQDFK